MAEQPIKIQNHGKYDNEKGWYFRFDYDRNRSYKYTILIT